MKIKRMRMKIWIKVKTKKISLMVRNFLMLRYKETKKMKKMMKM